MQNTETEVLINRQLYILSISKIFKDVATGMLVLIIPLYVANVDTLLLNDIPAVLKAGLAAALFGLANSISQPFMGKLSERLDRRKLFLTIGYSIFAILCILYARSEYLESILFLRIIQGIAIGATIPAIIAMVTHLSESTVRGQAIGIYSSLRGFAFGIGSVLGGAVVTYYGYVSGFYISAALVLLSLVLISFFVKETHIPQTKPIQDTADEKSSIINVLAVAMFMMMVGIMLILSLLPAYQSRLIATEFALSIAFSAYVITRIVFQVPMGIISDRFGRKFLIIAGIFLNAAIVYGLGHVGDINSLIFLRVLQGIAMAAVETPLLALAVEISGEEKVTSRVSTITGMQAAGMAMGPLVGGIFGGYVSFETPFHLSSVLILLSGLLVWWTLRTQKEIT
ncbi:MFS family permease [Methanohalophilus levihalophilus]|uniref:MFS transporter n=1 Tax=Methanohalophilus levihalophilus TaxID=1431282 RepID=UPI001AE1D55B|nr:MFS transporter [Methanohalophilus levihalophilus]MBP2029628.1 MFS family permease [Methanohalophilus levihalophilus]